MWIFYSTQNFQCDQKVPEGGPNERQRLLLLRLLFRSRGEIRKGPVSDREIGRL